MKFFSRLMCLGVAFAIPVSVLSQTNTPSPVPDLRSRILETAEASVGSKMWTGYGLANGKLGCAAALSNVLKKSGCNYAHSAAVVVIRKQLLNSPLNLQEISIKKSEAYGVDQNLLRKIASPGDLIFGYKTTPDKPNTGGDAHCGVVAANSNVYGNDWGDGVWKRVEVDRYFAWYPFVYVIKTNSK
ncbi:MAG: hypothetical protein IAF58_12395 [Leptolyngbya sp.]|nr:hypothetical protein [Candidatus Melainabacteria bacterium]